VKMEELYRGSQVPVPASVKLDTQERIVKTLKVDRI